MYEAVFSTSLPLVCFSLSVEACEWPSGSGGPRFKPAHCIVFLDNELYFTFLMGTGDVLLGVTLR